MNMRKKILFSAGALAVALAPAVGFALPAAQAVTPEMNSSHVSFTSLTQQLVPVPTAPKNVFFIFDEDGDYLGEQQESALDKIARTTYKASGHQLIYVSTTDPSFDDDTEKWTDNYVAHNDEIGEDYAIFVSGTEKYHYGLNGKTLDIIGDQWDTLKQPIDAADGDEFQIAQVFFSTFSSYLISKPINQEAPPQTQTPASGKSTPADTDPDTPNLISADGAPTKEYGDIIEFPDSGQIAYVGGQKDVKSAAPFIRDHSGVFSKSKIAGWEQRLTALAQKYGIAPYIVTVDDFQNKEVQQWAADYYNANELGLDLAKANGVLMLINPVSRDLQFLGHGDGEKAFTPYGIEGLYNHVKEPLGDDDWDGGVEVYLTQVADYLEQWKAGTPYNEGHPIPHPMTLESTAAGAAGAAALGGGAGAVVMGRLKRKHNTVSRQATASYYVVPGSNQITASNEVFANRYTTKVARPKNDDSDSSYSGGSYSSGGTSFSSGGGKF